MGADRQLASAAAIERYFEQIAAASDRVELVDLGRTTEGNRTIAAIISAPDNIQNLARIRATNQRLADPRTLPQEDARTLAATHKAVVAIGAGIHASEVGGTQAANELLHTLATTSDPGLLGVLQNIVIVLIPSLNPDGHRLVVDWYEKQKGTAFEGGPMPWLYHKYAGHDLNRDAFMMNMAENRNLARFFYTQWHPAGVPHDAPDGAERSAVLRPAERRSDRPELRSAPLAHGGTAGQCDGARAAA